MTTAHFTAKVKDTRLLELPAEAQELGLKPGEEVQVSVVRSGANQSPEFPRNEGMLAALLKIAEIQKDMPNSSGADSLKLLREARSGTMYGYEPTE